MMIAYKKEGKQQSNVSIDEYITWCQEDITLDEYLKFEQIRAEQCFDISPSEWTKLLKKQSMKCYYCNTELEIIQQLILKGIIKPRKRGSGGYSGLHFELDHKNCDKIDNCEENVVASCYYCNNDKSNTISCDTFRDYFGKYKKDALQSLFQDSGLTITNQFRHHLKGKPSQFD